MSRDIVFSLNNPEINNLHSDTVQALIDDALHVPDTQPVMVRPPRASKARAMSKIKTIHQWENCSENSKMFRQAEQTINAEFDALHPEERDVSEDDQVPSEHEIDSNDEDESDLSFVDPDSEVEDDAASWSASEEEMSSESDSEEDVTDDDIPELCTEAPFDFDGLTADATSWADSVMNIPVTPPYLQDSQSHQASSPSPSSKRRRIDDTNDDADRY